MKIGLIGVGVVGGAVKNALELVGKYDVVAYDKFKPEFSDFESLLDAPVIFVSVPTLNDKHGVQDLFPLEETCERLHRNNYSGVVINKCTVLPGTTDRFSEKYGLRMLHSPEFLTAAHAKYDFIHQKSVIIGGNSTDIMAVLPIFERLSETTPTMLFDSCRKTEMIKYTHNLFLSVKVSFFNEIYEVCSDMKIDFNQMMEGVHSVGQVGRGHTSVPGPDNQYGFGGMCFPKDTNAFREFAKQNRLSMPVLEAAIIGNNRRRPEEQYR